MKARKQSQRRRAIRNLFRDPSAKELKQARRHATRLSPYAAVSTVRKGKLPDNLFQQLIQGGDRKAKSRVYTFGFKYPQQASKFAAATEGVGQPSIVKKHGYWKYAKSFDTVTARLPARMKSNRTWKTDKKRPALSAKRKSVARQLKKARAHARSKGATVIGRHVVRQWKSRGPRSRKIRTGYGLSSIMAS